MNGWEEMVNIFKLIWYIIVFPFTIMFKIAQVYISYTLILCISMVLATVVYPFYGIYTMIRIIRKSRAKRDSRPKRKRGVRILLAVGRVVWWILLFELLFFYVIYLVFRLMISDQHEKKEVRKREDDLSWIDRLEEYDALFN